MYSFLSKYGQLIGLGVGLFFIILFFAVVMMNGDALEGAAAIDDRVESNKFLSATSTFDIGLYAVYLLVVGSALAILIFGILDVVKDPKGSVKSLVGIGALIVMFIVGYMISQSSGDGAGIVKAIAKFNGMIEVAPGDNITDSFSYLTSGKSSLIGGGLMMTFILGGIAFLGLVASEVMNLFR